MMEYPESIAKRVFVLGVGISPVNIPLALDTIAGWIEHKLPHYVCCVPAHTVMECYDHPKLRQVYNGSGMTTPDGMPMVWLCRWYGQRQVKRVYGPDLMAAVCELGVQSGWRHYFYGGAPGVAETLSRKLQERYPGLQVAGLECPPFRALTVEEDAAVGERIRAARPDIVWVGISSPRQDLWMAEHVSRLNVPVLVGVGAAFDFLSETKPQAPRWIQYSGLEWLFRLLSEPQRLWKRYVLNYPRFVVLVLMQVLGMKRVESGE